MREGSKESSENYKTNSQSHLTSFTRQTLYSWFSHFFSHTNRWAKRSEFHAKTWIATNRGKHSSISRSRFFSSLLSFTMRSQEYGNKIQKTKGFTLFTWMYELDIELTKFGVNDTLKWRLVVTFLLFSHRGSFVFSMRMSCVLLYVKYK